MLRDDDLVEEVEDIVESEVELDYSDVVEPDYDPPVEMGNSLIEVTEENREAAQVSKSKAMDAILEGKLEEAISHLTEAIELNPKSALLYASRASVFVKLKKPNAAIRDANAALKIDADLAKGYKARGIGRALLGWWEEAARDLQVASKLDFDEETTVMLKKVKNNAQRVQEHRRKYKRLRKDRELRKIELQKLRSAKEAEFSRTLSDGQVIRVQCASELRMKLKAASKTSRLAVVYFTATWCGPCRYIGPVYTSLAAKYPKVVFMKVDIDEVLDAAAEWKISSIPSFYLSKKGKVVDEQVEINMTSLENKIAQHGG